MRPGGGEGRRRFPPWQGLAGLGLAPLNRLLGGIERRAVAGTDASLPAAPMFILGAPRTGSTLLYQTLVQSLAVGYLNNAQAMLHGAPLLVARWGGHRPPGGEFRSDLGLTRGWSGPSEAGAFWYRWFPRDVPHVSDQDVAVGTLLSLRQVVGALTRRLGPMLFKNLTNSMRIRVLASLFPEARFVVVERDLLWTAQSILLARIQVHGNPTRWWSVRVPGWQRLQALPPEEQVTSQVVEIDRIIDADARLVGAERFLRVRYEDFCGDPAAAIEAIRAHWAAAGGVTPDRRGPAPEAFRTADRPRLPEAQFAALRQAVSRVAAREAAT